jgi:hypothetical protein
MTGAEATLELLKHRNPFASSSVGDPWDSHYPHVSSINEQAFDGLCHLMAQKVRTPSLNCAALVLGEVGSGKTHLLGRILSHASQVQPPVAFAYIQPIEDPDQTYRYLLREVVINLCRTAHTTAYATQLDALVAEMCIEVLHDHSRPQGRDKLQTLQRHGLNVLTYLRPAVWTYVRQWAIDLLAQAYPDISARFLHVLLQLPLPAQRLAAINWLKADVLDTADAERLGVPDRFHASSTYLEQEAREILASLGLVLARYHQPLILCFDRLENLETPAQIQAFGKMVEFLVDTAKGMLPIACVRGQQWQERLKQVLNQHVTSRLETNRFALQGCTAEQAIALVRSRLASVLEADAAEALFPFDAEELQHMFQIGFHSPRVVIARVNARLQQIVDAGLVTPSSSYQVLQEVLGRQIRTILQDFDRYPPDRHRLRRALDLYLSYCSVRPHGPIESVRQPDTQRKYIDLVGTLRDGGASTPMTIRPVTVLIDVESHPAAVSASLNRGIDALEAEPTGLVIYVRDARCALPSQWKTTNDKLQRFKALGGCVILLDREQAARWYALALLSYAVREGDITWVTAEQQLRAVSQDEFATFIQRALDGDAGSIFGEIEAVLGNLERGDPT